MVLGLPLRGSRFSIDGVALNGPAIAALAPVEATTRCPPIRHEVNRSGFGSAFTSLSETHFCGYAV
jgi:hypothetical protein